MLRESRGTRLNVPGGQIDLRGDLLIGLVRQLGGDELARFSKRTWSVSQAGRRQSTCHATERLHDKLDRSLQLRAFFRRGFRLKKTVQNATISMSDQNFPRTRLLAGLTNPSFVRVARDSTVGTPRG